MQKYERIFSSIKEGTSLLDMIRSGFKPEDVKKASIAVLDSYFENKDVLEHYAIYLIPEAINLIRLREKQLFGHGVEKCLLVYRSAKVRDSHACFKSFALWQPRIAQSLTKFWTILHMEADKSALEIEEFLHECLRNMGDIVEGLSQPYLKILLHQLRITKGNISSLEDVDSLELGQIVNELMEQGNFVSLLAVPPWNVRLNQWRNIAYHHSARIEEDDNIICWYGKSPDIKHIKITRNELTQIAQAMFKVFSSVKVAHTLFYVDNSEDISRFSTSACKEREESGFLNFAVALASQGFEILEYRKSQDEARIIVRDVSNLDPANRRFHASQFLFPLWLLTEAKKLIVEYRERDNTPNLLVSTFSDICEKIYNSELEIEELAKTMSIVDLKTKRTIKPLSNG